MVENSYFNIDLLSGKKVLVVGDLMLDHYIHGTVERISPEAPVPILDVNRTSYTIGGAGNVVKNLVTLETDVTVCSVIGLDNDGEKLFNMLNIPGIDRSGIFIDPDRKTSLKTRVVSGTHQIVRIDKEDKNRISNKFEEELISFILNKIHNKEIDAIIISDYAKGVITKEIIEAITSNSDIMVNVDPKDKNFSYYKNVDTITPNLKELSLGMESKIKDDESLNILACNAIKLLNCKVLMVTKGPEGMSIFTKDENPIHIKAVARKVFDVTGAGDTVISVYTLSRLAGYSIEISSVISNIAAGIVVGEFGAATITIPQLEAEIDKVIYFD